MGDDLPPSAASREQESDLPRETRRARLAPGAFVLVLVAGLIATGAVTWVSVALDNHQQSHLVRIQAEEAGEVIVAALPGIESPLSAAAQVAMATHGSAGEFRRAISPFLGHSSGLVTASLWGLKGSHLLPLATAGSAPQFASDSLASAAVRSAFRTRSLFVDSIQSGSSERIGLAYAAPVRGSDFAVYAESAVPADRHSAVSSNPAFSNLYYAIYLGSPSSQSNVLTYDFSQLPPSGSTVQVKVPFGNSDLTLVAAPRTSLLGAFASAVPWLFGVLGFLSSLAAAWLVSRLVRRRQSAESDAAEIHRLYGELDEHFDRQRSISETLQRALLPLETPWVPGIEVAVQYAPGTVGLEIGGDWYSLVPLENGRFGFVVGDASGRGLSAATVMAALRFTIRVYLLEGYSPAEVLEKSRQHLEILRDGHFATVLLGVADTSSREVVFANAGHLNPLVINGDSTGYIDLPVGVPLGVSGGSYHSATVTLQPRSTLIAFTDGLVENRTEGLDVRLGKLEQVMRGASGPLDDLLIRAIGELTGGKSEDDIAMLGLRWMN